MLVHFDSSPFNLLCTYCHTVMVLWSDLQTTVTVV